VVPALALHGAAAFGPSDGDHGPTTAPAGPRLARGYAVAARGTAASMRCSDAPTRFLAVYLNDHLAGSTVAVELARRASGEYEGTELGRFLARLATEIAEDREALRRVMDAAGTRPDRAKIALAWVGEKAGRLKLNGRILGRSPLSPVVELEILAIGITGKLLLWRLLREQRLPGSGAVDLDDLIARAERQREEVEEHRIAAGAALGA
jgi:hypothetical protein